MTGDHQYDASTHFALQLFFQHYYCNHHFRLDYHAFGVNVQSLWLCYLVTSHRARHCIIIVVIDIFAVLIYTIEAHHHCHHQLSSTPAGATHLYSLAS